MNVLEIQFEGLDPFSLEAVECFKEAYKRATEEGKIVKAILLCSPNNPLGLSSVYLRPAISDSHIRSLLPSRSSMLIYAALQ